MSRKNVLKYSGGFIAWVIGSGFATGQEMLQFYTSYSLYSIGIIAINLVLFVYIGPHLLVTGYDHKDVKDFNQYEYFCGKTLGSILKEVVPIIIFAIMVILISGAGATLEEYYGLNHYVGAAIMAGLILAAYLFGFDRLVSIIAVIGPIIIVFTVLVGVITLAKDYSNLQELPKYYEMLEDRQSTRFWWFSGLLYASYNIFCGSTYYCSLGASANVREEAKWGAILGSVALIVAISIMNFAMLANAGEIVNLSIPTLFLASRISRIFGEVFSLVLLAGIFSSSSPMMWTVCNRFVKEGTNKAKVFAVIVAAVAFLCGLLPFAQLVNKIYPYLGYIGIAYLVCVIYDKIKSRI